MSWEEDFIRAFQAIANPALDAFFRAVTELGSDLPWLLLIAFCFALGRRRQAVGLSVLVVSCFYISYVIKHVVMRPRPPEELQRTDLLGAPKTGPSMPSTHATEAAANLTYVAKELRDVRAYVACAALAILAALSRVYLGVHWPTDVLAGLCLGLAIVAIYAVAAEARLAERLGSLGRERAYLVLLPIAIGILAALLTPQEWGRPPTYIGGLIAGAFSGAIISGPIGERDPRDVWNVVRAVACTLIGLLGLVASYVLGVGPLQFIAAAATGLWVSWLGPRALWAIRGQKGAVSGGQSGLTAPSRAS